MRNHTTWIVVADGHRARFLMHNHGPLRPALDHDLTAPNPLDHEIGDDRPGRGKESAGNARHALEPRIDHHRQRKVDFAHLVASQLEEAAEQRRFDRLVVVAPPQAMGDLRGAMGHQARERVSAELPLDLTHETLPEIQARLVEVLRPPL